MAAVLACSVLAFGLVIGACAESPATLPGPDGSVRDARGAVDGARETGSLDDGASDAPPSDGPLSDSEGADAGITGCDAGPAPPTSSCRSGYTPLGAACLRPYQPSLAVSSTRVAPGTSVRATWNGGAYANTCAITSASWPSAPWGSELVDVATDTTVSMTCIDAAGEYLSPRPDVLVHVEPDAALHPFLRARSAIERARFEAWMRADAVWEVEYDGTGAPTDGVSMAYVWDNPIDDDGLELYALGRGFRFDTPSPGFLTIDRHADPGDWIKGGVISRRDEHLDSAYGLTLELRVQIAPESGIYADADGVVRDHDAFRVHYQMENGVVLGLFLSPTTIKAGGYALPPVSVPFDTTGFHTYRIVQASGSAHFAVYVDDNATPILEADGTDLYPVASVHDREHPTIIVGGEGVFRAKFVLDYVRYRRGAYPPGASIPPVVPRTPSPLPPPRPACTHDPWTGVVDGASLPNTPGQPLEGYVLGGPPGWSLLPDGILELNELPPGGVETAYVPVLQGITGRGDVTIEARIRVLRDSGARGFSLFLSDDLGTTGVVFSPDRVELVLGIKNVGHRDIGIQTALLDTTDAFHTYRLVRPAGQLYAHLYIDDDPIPRIVDQHPDASTRLGPAASATTSYLVLGHQFNPSTALGHVLIDAIRWAPTAYGPPLR